MRIFFALTLIASWTMAQEKNDVHGVLGEMAGHPTTTRLVGRIVDLKGQPIVGAKIQSTTHAFQRVPIDVATTNRLGAFSGTFALATTNRQGAIARVDVMATGYVRRRLTIDSESVQKTGDQVAAIDGSHEWRLLRIRLERALELDFEVRLPNGDAPRDDDAARGAGEPLRRRGADRRELETHPARTAGGRDSEGRGGTWRKWDGQLEGDDR